MKTSIASIVLCAFLAACGGGGGDDGSGVDGDKAITDLSASEASAFCEWAIEVQGGEGYVEDCGDFTYEVGTVAECEAEYGDIPPACSTVTVAEMEACVEAMGDNPCESFGAQVCAEFFQCVLGGQ